MIVRHIIIDKVDIAKIVFHFIGLVCGMKSLPLKPDRLIFLSTVALY